GVFGIWNTNDAAALTALGLHALQHRGQEAAGIVSLDEGGIFHAHRGRGLVGDTFSDAKIMASLRGRAAAGHNRYATTGETALRQVQGAYSLVALHDGALIGARDIFGVRPLVLGRLGGTDGVPTSWVLCSETCALDIVGAEFVRDIDAGEIIIIDDQGVRSIK